MLEGGWVHVALSIVLQIKCKLKSEQVLLQT